MKSVKVRSLPRPQVSNLGRLAQLVERVSYTDDVAGSSPAPPTTKEIASFGSPPRFARRPVCIEFLGQKRIGDFLKHGSSRLFSEMLSFPLCFRSQLNWWLDS